VVGSFAIAQQMLLRGRIACQSGNRTVPLLFGANRLTLPVMDTYILKFVVATQILKNRAYC